ncbi:MAG: hypothetical protein MHM6MM_003242 [Cercozoa sp. M6MM]
MTSVLSEVRGLRGGVNLSNIRRRDPSVRELLASARHVHVFAMQHATRTWQEQKVDGPCFLVRRSEEPHFRLCVMSRQRAAYWLRDLSADSLVESQGAYLFLRLSKQGGEDNDLALWHYDAADVPAFVEAVKTAVHLLQQTRLEREHSKRPSLAQSMTSPMLRPLVPASALRQSRKQYDTYVPPAAARREMSVLDLDDNNEDGNEDSEESSKTSVVSNGTNDERDEALEDTHELPTASPPRRSALPQGVLLSPELIQLLLNGDATLEQLFDKSDQMC